MSQYDLQELYKELYFHELAVREKLTNRIQLTFAFHATLLTVLSYIVRMVDYNSPQSLLIFFYTLLGVCLCFVAKSIYEIINAFWGNTYKALSSPQNIENYREELIEHASEIENYKKQHPNVNIESIDINKELDSFLYKDFSESASHNSSVNDKRSAHIHDGVTHLLKALIPFLIASSCFILFDMDSSSPRKQFLIEYQGVTKSIDDFSKNILTTLNEIKNEVSRLQKENINEKERRELCPKKIITIKHHKTHRPPHPLKPQLLPLLD